MRVVVDANVLVGASYSLDLGPLKGHQLLAPAHARSEVLSTIREMAYRGEVPTAAVDGAIEFLYGLGLVIRDDLDLARRSYDVAERLGWAKTYDAAYVALASIEGIALVTLDARLRRGAADLATILSPDELSAA